MSTDDNTIKIMRYDGLLVMGDYCVGKLLKPRVIMPQQQPGPQGQMMVSFVSILGVPEEMAIPTGALIWDCLDEQLITGYREAVTGLVLAKKPALTNLSLVGGKA